MNPSKTIAALAERGAARAGGRALSATWHNHAGNQTCHPRAIVSPGSLDELVELVRRAEREGTTVRAVGAGHAWSDAALTDGYLVLPDNLGGVIDLDDGTLASPRGPSPLQRVLGGTHIYALNEALDAAGLALPQMGGYDGQTLAGVVSTSTHGSGLAWGPFPDLVRSLDLVVAGGDVVRIEPAFGITDPAGFASVYAGERRLIQDDDTFAAAVCGMGCMGIVHSLVIEVREKFWLNEVRTLSTWEATRDTLTVDGVLGEGDHYELFLNPYPRDDGQHSMLVTRRRDCPEPTDLPEDKQRRHPLTELEASLPITGVVLRFLARHLPWLMVRRFDTVLDEMQDDGYASVSYRVFNIGEANHLPADLDGAVRGYRGRPAPDGGGPRARDRGRAAQGAPALPHVPDRAALHGAVAGVRVDDARPRVDDLRADPGDRHPRRGRAAGRLRGGARRPRRARALGPVQPPDRGPHPRRLPALGRLDVGAAPVQLVRRVRLAVHPPGGDIGLRSERTLSEARPSAVAALTWMSYACDGSAAADTVTAPVAVSILNASVVGGAFSSGS